MRIVRKLLSVIVLVVVVSSTFTAILPNSAQALSGSEFQAGRIIDDVVFFNGNDLTVQQVQAFLVAKVPACDTNGTQPYAGTTRAAYGASRGYPAPYTCLKDYRQVTVAKAAESGLCNGYIVAEQSAAEIIKGVASSCGISQRALIVLLEKEQSLVTDDWPWSIQYRSATGFGCPDTAPCDAEYYGFFNQVYSAARQFKRYARDSHLFNYSANTASYVLYNPNASCGGSSVYIQNQATAGLYNYTPYQPNASALNNLYGTGDSCGAYGNRNFWRIYNDWFGSTYGDLVRAPNGGIYKLENGTKRAIPNEVIFLSYSYSWSGISSLSSSQLSLIPDGPPMPYNVHFRNGHLVSSPTMGMYVVENGLKRPFPNEGTFFSYSFKFSDALGISNLEINLIPDGAPMPFNAQRWNGHLVSSSSGGMYVVDNGKKRPFANEITFLSYSYRFSDALVISNPELSLIPEGIAMPYNVNFRNGYLVTSASRGMYVIDNGTKRPFPNEGTFFSYGFKFSDALVISNTEMNLMPDGVAMPMKP